MATTSERSAASAGHRRFCRTPEEAFQAGWDDGANDPPLSASQVMRLALLLGPHIRTPDSEVRRAAERAA